MLLAVTRATFARIHWRHDFSRRAPRRAGNDNASAYWTRVREALIRPSGFAAGTVIPIGERGAAAMHICGGAPTHDDRVAARSVHPLVHGERK